MKKVEEIDYGVVDTPRLAEPIKDRRSTTAIAMCAALALSAGVSGKAEAQEHALPAMGAAALCASPAGWVPCGAAALGAAAYAGYSTYNSYSQLPNGRPNPWAPYGGSLVQSGGNQRSVCGGYDSYDRSILYSTDTLGACKNYQIMTRFEVPEEQWCARSILGSYYAWPLTTVNCGLNNRMHWRPYSGAN